MDPKAENAPIGHHHHLSDVNPDTDATSVGHHGLNNVDSGAGDAGAEHHQTIGTGEAPVQHGQTTGVDIGNAPVFSGDGAQLNIQQTNAHNNAGSVLVQLDQLTNQHRTCVFAREEARKSVATCVDTESNSGLSQDDRLHQTATHIYVGAAPTLHTQSRMTTESCYLAASCIANHTTFQPASYARYATSFAAAHYAANFTATRAPHTCCNK